METDTQNVMFNQTRTSLPHHDEYQLPSTRSVLHGHHVALCASRIPETLYASGERTCYWTNFDTGRRSHTATLGGAFIKGGAATTEETCDAIVGEGGEGGDYLEGGTLGQEGYQDPVEDRCVEFGCCLDKTRTEFCDR